MTKHLAFASLLTVFCGTALADPAPATYQISLGIASGKSVRNYAVKLVDHACGGVESKTPAVHDEIKLCATAEGGGVKLDVDWHTTEGNRELRERSTVIVARGVKFVLEGSDAMLTVAVQ